MHPSNPNPKAAPNSLQPKREDWHPMFGDVRTLQQEFIIENRRSSDTWLLLDSKTLPHCADGMTQLEAQYSAATTLEDFKTLKAKLFASHNVKVCNRLTESEKIAYTLLEQRLNKVLADTNSAIQRFTHLNNTEQLNQLMQQAEQHLACSEPFKAHKDLLSKPWLREKIAQYNSDEPVLQQLTELQNRIAEATKQAVIVKITEFMQSVEVKRAHFGPFVANESFKGYNPIEDMFKFASNDPILTEFKTLKQQVADAAINAERDILEQAPNILQRIKDADCEAFNMLNQRLWNDKNQNPFYYLLNNYDAGTNESLQNVRNEITKALDEKASALRVAFIQAQAKENNLKPQPPHEEGNLFAAHELESEPGAADDDQGLLPPPPPPGSQSKTANFLSRLYAIFASLAAAIWSVVSYPFVYFANKSKAAASPAPMLAPLRTNVSVPPPARARYDEQATRGFTPLHTSQSQDSPAWEWPVMTETQDGRPAPYAIGQKTRRNVAEGL